jgi:hypothetical protein
VVLLWGTRACISRGKMQINMNWHDLHPNKTFQ